MGETMVHEVATVTGFTIPASSMRDLLAGALVAVGKDKTIPTLTGVFVEWEPGLVRAVATDRYRLALGEYANSALDGVSLDGSGSVLIPAEMVKSLVKALPKVAHEPVGWERATLSVDDGVISVSWPGGSASGVALIGEYPQYKSLIPSEFDGTDRIAFDPSYLADVAKIPHRRGDAVRWQFVRSDRPAVATFPEWHGVSWTYLLMPVRLG